MKRKTKITIGICALVLLLASVLFLLWFSQKENELTFYVLFGTDQNGRDFSVEVTKEELEQFGTGSFADFSVEEFSDYYHLKKEYDSSLPAS